MNDEREPCPCCGQPTIDIICGDCCAESWHELVAKGCEFCAGAIGGSCPKCGRDVDAAAARVNAMQAERRKKYV
jgi:hypothetical protein